jgi:hypothetical protein
MTTTPAAKGIRIAALGLSAVLSIGALTPFIGASSAAAADCTTVSHSYSTASAKLAKHHAKLVKAKKKLKKDRKHHKSHATIKHDKKMVKKFKRKVRADKSVKNTYYIQRTQCTTAPTQAAVGSANALTSLLGQLRALDLDPAVLTDGIKTAADQIAASGAPGAAQLAGVLDQVADALATGASSIDPSQLQAVLDQLPTSVDPAKFQQALTDAVATLQRTLADPPTTPEGIIDTLLGAVSDGLTTAGVPALPGVIDQVQDLLDQILGPIFGAVGR